jgi:hypothetical protein
MIYYLLYFVLLIASLLFLWLLKALREIKFWRNDSSKWYTKACGLSADLKFYTRDGLTTVPAEVVERCNALENENAELRVDVETGCQIIEQQKATINGLRTLLAQSQGRNKRLK